MIVGWLAVALAGAEEPRLECAGDAVAAVEDAFQMLVVDGSGSAIGDVAVCLERLGLPHLAQRHWLEVVRMGRAEPLHRHALHRTFALAEQLGDPFSVAWALQGLDERALTGGPAVDAMLLAHAWHLLAEGRVEHAVSVLQDVDRSSRWYPHAQLELGRALQRSGRVPAALRAFRAAADAADDELGSEAVLEEVRLHAARGAVREAVARLEASGDDAVSGAVHAEVAGIWLDRWEAREARLHVRQAAKAARRALLPEVGLLEARLAWAQCRPRRAERALARWRPEHAALTLVVQGVAGTGHPDGAHVYRSHLGPDAVDVGLPPSAVDATGTAASRGIRAHLDLLDGEAERLAGLGDAEWQATMGAYLADVLEDGRRALHAELGERFLADLRALARRLDQLDRDAASLERLAADGVWGACGR